jgi:hypothetical protein
VGQGIERFEHPAGRDVVWIMLLYLLLLLLLLLLVWCFQGLAGAS